MDEEREEIGTEDLVNLLCSCQGYRVLLRTWGSLVEVVDNQ